MPWHQYISRISHLRATLPCPSFISIHFAFFFFSSNILSSSHQLLHGMTIKPDSWPWPRPVVISGGKASLAQDITSWSHIKAPGLVIHHQEYILVPSSHHIQYKHICSCYPAILLIAVFAFVATIHIISYSLRLPLSQTLPGPALYSGPSIYATFTCFLSFTLLSYLFIFSSSILPSQNVGRWKS